MREVENQNDMEWRVSLSKVEELLNYKFKNRKLLEEALTHPSCRNGNHKTVSYQRLEFVGDAVLSIAFADFFFNKYTKLEEGRLTLLRQANTTNEKLARVAVGHRLYTFLRGLDTVQVEEFALAVQQEEEIETIVYRGAVKADKVLSDIVESVIGAVYFDCGFDIKFIWQVIENFLQPIITYENLPSQRMTELVELCQKQGKPVYTKVWRAQDTNYCGIYLDGELFVRGSSDQNKDIAKREAAREALLKLDPSCMSKDIATFFTGYELDEIEAPKTKLNNLCAHMKWVMPDYRNLLSFSCLHLAKPLTWRMRGMDRAGYSAILDGNLLLVAGTNLTLMGLLRGTLAWLQLVWLYDQAQDNGCEALQQIWDTFPP